MICSIDAEQCANGISVIGLMPTVGLMVLLLLSAAVVYQFRELLGGLLILLIGAAVLYSVGLLQVLFVLSFIPAVVYFSMLSADGNWRGWRRWHLGLWLAAPSFIAATALAVFAHEETKLLVTIINLFGTVLLVWGLLKYVTMLAAEEQQRTGTSAP